MITLEFLDFYEFTLYMILAIILKMTILIMAIFVEKSYKELICKNPRIHFSYHFCHYLSKMTI